MDKAKINGYDLEYSVKDAKSKKWVVFIHGSVFENMFVPVMSHPALSDYSILHYHRRGYGGSDYKRSSPPSINELSSDCLNLMKSQHRTCSCSIPFLRRSYCTSSDSGRPKESTFSYPYGTSTSRHGTRWTGVRKEIRKLIQSLSGS